MLSSFVEDEEERTEMKQKELGIQEMEDDE